MYKRLLTYLLIGLMFGIVISIILYLTNSRGFVSKKLNDQISFSVMHPGSNSRVRTDKSSITYDPAQKYITYTGKYNSQPLTISEQSTPQQYIDIPEAFARQMDQWHESSTFISSVGTVHITRPEHKTYTAVLNERGTLVFVTSITPISNEDWRQIFRSMTFDS